MIKYLLSFFILIFFVSLLAGCGEKAKEAGEVVVEQTTGIGAVEKKIGADKQIAIAKAKALFVQQVAQGIDMSRGPCLANDLMPDWVADVAHNPRQDIDSLPENQCSAYRAGKANHFVELDPSGSLIKAE